MSPAHNVKADYCVVGFFIFCSGLKRVLHNLMARSPVKYYFFLLSVMIGGVISESLAKTISLPPSRKQISISFAPVVREVAPAVVNIYAKVMRKQRTRSLFDDPFFRRFFGEGVPFGQNRKRLERSLGSGVIVSNDGIVVTNYHVIKNAQEIKIILSDRREFDAKVILKDSKTDLAVLSIEIENEDLPTVSFGDADALQVGDLVIAIGNPFGVGQTVTSGIVSALARTNVGISDFRSFIQTDAAINPGNSGGALVDLNGQLIGINTAIFSRGGGGSVGIGFAVPSNMVRAVVETAMSGKPLVRPWLSLSGTAVTADMAEGLGLSRPTGVLVESIYPKGPAERAGIERGDVITHIEDYGVEDEFALRFRLAARPIGKSAELRFLRQGKVRKTEFKLIAPPEIPPRNTTIVQGRNPFAGLKVVNLSPAVTEKLGIRTTSQGVMISAILRGSPAIEVGFLAGDIIIKVNGQVIKRVQDLERILKASDSPWNISIKRGKKIHRIRLR